jgi:PTH1 family peptidyl-tRNA hydrolase
VDDQQADRRTFVVGLGNPGRQYAATRHNVGFRVVEALWRRWQAEVPRRAFGGLVCEARPSRPEAGTRRVVLLEPHTYMNCSGQAVQEMAAFYKAELNEILVVLDDMALPVGQLRARAGGSTGGQKGLADVLLRLGSQQVPRLRIGIGGPPGRMDGADFVLSKFADAEQEIIDVVIAQAAMAVEDWVFRGLDYVMERYNRKYE